MVVHAVLDEDSTISFGAAEVLFDASGYLIDNFHVTYDMTPDDQSFILVAITDVSGGDVILVVNWLEEVKAKLRR